jgi:hypothetical protein
MPLGLSVLLIVVAVVAVAGFLGVLIDKSADREVPGSGEKDR